MTYIDSHPLRAAFVANVMERFVNQVAEQGDDMLFDAGITFPSRVVSIILLLGEKKSVSAADIARELALPHQLVTQRINLLIELGIVSRTEDASDARRKVVLLTGEGRSQYRRLKQRLALVNQAFEALFEEIGCDLFAAASRALAALHRSPILNRVRSNEGVLA